MKTNQLRFLALTLALTLFSWTASAVTGWYEDYVSLNVNGTTTQYAMSSTGTDLNGQNLGAVGTLKITACDLKYWDEQHPDGRTGGAINYKIMASDNTTQVIAPVENIWSQTFLGSNDYQGTLSGLNVNLLSGLTVGTTYKLHVWAKSWGGAGGDSYLNNSNNDYVVTFTYNPVTIYGANGITDGTGYATLKGAFDAINAKGTQAGMNILVKINGSTTETASADLSQPATSTWSSLKIYPTGADFKISGNFAGQLIKLTGADNVTIDGSVGGTGSDKSLTLEQLNSGKGTVYFISDATYNTVKNCIIKGGGTDNALGIVSFAAATTTGNDYNTITNNDITLGSSTRSLLYAVCSVGTVAKNNDHLTISNNRIFNIFPSTSTLGNAAAIALVSATSDCTISGNNIYEEGSGSTCAASTTTLTFYGILVGSNVSTENGFTITGNYIGGSASSCGGTPMTLLATATSATRNVYFCGIGLNVGSGGTTSVVENNTIQNINFKNTTFTNASTPDLAGIFAQGNGNVTIGGTDASKGNTIGGATVGSITFTGYKASSVYGITTGASGNTGVFDIKYNTINNISANVDVTTYTGLVNLWGINKILVGTAGNISNNTISNLSTNSVVATAVTQTLYGIQSSGATMTISNNTIHDLTNASTSTTGNNVCQGIASVSTATTDISSNTVYSLNSSSPNTGSGTGSAVMGIISTGTASPTTAVTTMNNNTVYGLSNTNAGAPAVSGIYYGPTNTATTNTVSKNFVYGLAASGVGSKIRDFEINQASTGTVTVANNIASQTTNTDNTMVGIYDLGAVLGSTTKIYHNTIYFAGSLGTETMASYCLYDGNIAPTRDYRNNIFVNARTATAGTIYNYALGLNAQAQGTTLTIDNNNYYVPVSDGTTKAYIAKIGATNITAIGTGAGANNLYGKLTGTVTGNNVNSLNINPQFTGAASNLALGFFPRSSTLNGANLTLTVPTDFGNSNFSTTGNMGAYQWNVSVNEIAPAAKSSAIVARTTSGVSATFDGAAVVELYTVNGRLIERTNAVGSYTRSLNNGLYIIRINGKATKFVK